MKGQFTFYQSSYEREEQFHKETCMDKGFIMPIPYSQFTKFECSSEKGYSMSEKFDNFKTRIFGWVESSARSYDKRNEEFKISYIKEAFSFISKPNKEVLDFLIQNIKKVRIVPDFSGISYGIEVREQEDFWSFRCNEDFLTIDKKIFDTMNIVEKINFIFSSSEFIPFRFISDSSDSYDDMEEISHKFRVYEREEHTMKLLENFLSTCDNKPNPEKYYFLCFNRKTKEFYLKRDKNK